MENNEVMVNEEVMDAVEEATNGTYNGVMILSTGIVTLGAGYLLVKKVVIPVIEKIKAKKDAMQSEEACDENEDITDSIEK